jgi:hypothetical protein
MLGNYELPEPEVIDLQLIGYLFNSADDISDPYIQNRISVPFRDRGTTTQKYFLLVLRSRVIYTDLGPVSSYWAMGRRGLTRNR